MVKSRKQQSLLTTHLGLKEAKEAQENEIEALKAIFMEDYEPVVVTTAWKVVPTGHEFRLHLKPQEQELKKHVSVDLHVKFPKTYPRSAPDIKIENARGLSETHLNKAQGHISRLIKENIGQEMVYTIAQFIQEFITMNNNGVKVVTKQTSFHEQMLNRIEQMTKVEQKKAIEEEFRVRQLEEQERIILAQKINEETQSKMAKFEEERLKRKQMKVKEDQNSKKLVDASLAFPTVNFDAFVMLNPDASQDVPFKSVVLGPSIGKGTIGSTYLVQATNFQGKNVEPSERHVLVLKEISIVSPYYFNIEGKRKLEEIEKDLFRVKRLRHANLITIYESELGRSETGWNLYILMEYARGGTLEDLLKKCGTVQLPFAREYMKQLLDALDYVHANSFVHKGTIGSTYLVQATNFQGKNVEPSERHVLVLKEISIVSPYYFNIEGKRKLEEIEKDLFRVKRLRHANLITIYESELGRSETGWNLYILMEYARGGTLEDLLKKCGTVQLPFAREYMKQLLDALDYVHANSFVHKDIKASNILLTEVDGKGECVAKLSDVNFHRKLLDFHESFPFFNYSGNQSFKRWAPPEQETKPYSRKNDIWCLGVIFVQMLFGLNVIKQYNSLEDLLKSAEHEIPTDVRSILKSMFEQAHWKRPSPLELLNQPFFNDGSVNLLDTPLKFITSSGKTNNVRSNYHHPLNKDNNELAGSFVESNTQFAFSPPCSSQSTTFSRYRLDFEEIHFLGKGAFGEVVKARNKLDDRFYAIKKVRLNPNDIEKTRKILREITTLSRLHHQYVVRYYTTWFEDSDGAWKETESFSENIGGSLATSSLEEEEEDDDEDDDEDSNEEDDFSDDDEFDFLSTNTSNSKGYHKSQNHRHHPEITYSSSSSSSSSEFELHDDDMTKVMMTSNKNRIGNSKKFSPKEEKTRILYIQMEYCEKQTLKDIIDIGVKPDDGWRIFRQILEGLAHIHRSGMIHRDLKPSNIFLDANGDVKIGDFGLATTSDEVGSFRVSNFDRMNSREDSMTGDVGTTLYVAPEVLSNNKIVGLRYNHKVDIYSLGIIFFEICYKFSTEMERRVTILNLRKSEILFPKDFSTNKMENQVYIIRWCLHHNPKNRPTSLELLKSEWMPAKLEDEHVQEYVRTMANPNTPHYRTLISTLFTQSPDKHKDHTYDFNSGNIVVDQLSALTFGRVRDHMLRIFRHHGGVEISTPLMMPKSDIYEEDKKAVHLMDIEGGIVQLNYDLTVPFARYVSRNNITDIKRYVFDRVYRENIVGGQPRFVYEADFDIIHSRHSPMIAEAEIFKIVDEIIEEFPPLKSINYCFFLNHTNIIETIFDCCRIPEEIRRGVYSLLGQLEKKYSINQIRTQLSNKYKLPRSVLDELVLFDIKGDLEFITNALDKLISSTSMRTRIHDAIKDFKLLMKYAKCLGVQREIIISPLLVYNNHYYKNGIVFQVMDDNNRKDVLAAGGRYDSLIQQFRHPMTVTAVNAGGGGGDGDGNGNGGVGVGGGGGGSSSSTSIVNGGRQQIYATGVNIAMQKIVFTLGSYQSTILKMLQSKKTDDEKSFGYWASKKCDVYVASFGKVHLEERLDLIHELWAHNIKADFMYEESSDLTPEMLANACKKQGINWIVIMRHRNQDLYKNSSSSSSTSRSDSAMTTTVKVKNLLWKTEDEVPRNELCVRLNSEIIEQARIDLHSSGSKYHKHSLPPQSEQSVHDIGNSHQSIQMDSLNYQNNLSIYIVGFPSIKNNKKMKHKQKQFLIDKASANISGVIDQINKGGVPVLALDINREILRKFVDCNVLEDESFKSKVLDLIPAHQKEYLINVQETLKQRHQEGYKHVWLYSHRDDFEILYHYFL
ncbi:hypothetical protein Glove_55g46 [Diversispora epigaea]|uniref:non-specific serine/threonine protein kinase n=1 Tax=Diversispora epigaea TaxID=1348612 RepID=A0A397JLL6_9GLOM|nr:hypothetical protein Glove_55g46 [Diversispora epigaea]